MSRDAKSTLPLDDHEISISPASQPDDVPYSNGGKESPFTPTERAQVRFDETPSEVDTKKPWWNSIREPGSATQIVICALLAIAIGMVINATVNNVPQIAVVLIGIPGRLWLRALTCVVLPLIITAMILAMQRLKDMARGGNILARWTIGYYVGTTLIAITHSIILTSLVWGNLMEPMDAASLQVSAADQRLIDEREQIKLPEMIQQIFDSFVPNNLANALSTNSLLAVLVCAVVVGYLIEGGEKKSSLLRATKEVDRIITIIITFLIKLAPIGVFSLILSNIVRLDMASVGKNLGFLIGGALTSMFFHLFVVLPLIFFIVTRTDPFSYWFACSPAWITAWGSASSAATMPVTLKCVLARKNPPTVCKFTVPLGCLLNMDGTAIYFPVAVQFMASTQGLQLNPGDYVIILLLATLGSLAATPIPSSSLVLIVMICGSVNIPMTGMYAVIVAIDWFLDRFRTALNVSSDLFAAKVITKMAKFEESPEEGRENEEDIIEDAVDSYNRGEIRA